MSRLFLSALRGAEPEAAVGTGEAAFNGAFVAMRRRGTLELGLFALAITGAVGITDQ